MIVRHLGITHESQDAPFIGALICAIGCSHHCPGCHNQHLIGSPIIEESEEQIISKVKQNIFNKGIILAGLEWTEQPHEMYALTFEALSRGLEVMIYTHMMQYEFEASFPELIEQPKPLWCKYGPYQDAKATKLKSQYGIVLADPEQYIVVYNMSKGRTFYW